MSAMNERMKVTRFSIFGFNVVLRKHNERHNDLSEQTFKLRRPKTFDGTRGPKRGNYLPQQIV